MRKMIAVAILVLLATSLFAQSTVWFEGSFEDAKTKATKENKHLLVDFYSDG